MLTPDDRDDQELDLGIVASGDAEVDESLSVLSELDQLPIDQHPAAFENIHDQLSTALSKFDDVAVEAETDVDS